MLKMEGRSHKGYLQRIIEAGGGSFSNQRQRASAFNDGSFPTKANMLQPSIGRLERPKMCSVLERHSHGLHGGHGIDVQDSEEASTIAAWTN